MQANVARRDATGVLVEAEGVGLGPSRHLWGKELVTVRGWWTKICWIRISSLFPKHTTVDVWIDIGIYGAETGKEWWVVTDQDPYAFVRSVKKLVYGADVYSIHADSFTIWRKVKLAKRLVSCYAHRQYIYIYRYIIMYIYIFLPTTQPWEKIFPYIQYHPNFSGFSSHFGLPFPRPCRLVATIPFPLVPGFTALHETAAHGFREAATLLLANGRAPTNMRDARGADFSPRKVVDL